MQIPNHLTESGCDLGSCFQDIGCGIDGYELMSIAIPPMLFRLIIPLILHPAALILLNGDGDDLLLRSWLLREILIEDLINPAVFGIIPLFLGLLRHAFLAAMLIGLREFRLRQEPTANLAFLIDLHLPNPLCYEHTYLS